MIFRAVSAIVRAVLRCCSQAARSSRGFFCFRASGDGALRNMLRIRCGRNGGTAPLLRRCGFAAGSRSHLQLGRRAALQRGPPLAPAPLPPDAGRARGEYVRGGRARGRRSPHAHAGAQFEFATSSLEGSTFSSRGSFFRQFARQFLIFNDDKFTSCFRNSRHSCQFNRC